MIERKSENGLGATRSLLFVSTSETPTGKLHGDELGGINSVASAHSMRQPHSNGGGMYEPKSEMELPSPSIH